MHLHSMCPFSAYSTVIVFVGLASAASQAEVDLEFVDAQLVTRASTTGVGTERFDSNTFDEFPGVLSLAEQRESKTSDPEQKASASGQVLINCDYVATPELITASGFVAASAAATDTIGRDGPNNPFTVSSTGEGNGVFEARVLVVDAPATLTVSASITSFATPTVGNFRTRFAFRIFGNGLNRTAELDCGTFGGVNCGLTAIDEELVLQPGAYSISLDFIVNSRDGGGTFDDPETCNASLTANWSWTLAPEPCDLVWNVADGVLEEASSWSPERAPTDTATGCDNLVMNREGAYNVTMGTVAANSLRVTTGAPSFSGASLTLGAVVGTNGLMIGESGALSLLSGALNLPFGGSAVVGLTGPSSDPPSVLSLVGPLASIQQANSGTVVVGDGQSGVVNVLDGAVFGGGELEIGKNAPGTMQISGGTTAAPSIGGFGRTVVVGSGAEGALEVTNGGRFFMSDDMFVGLSGPGAVSVHTTSADGSPAMVDLDDLLIGGAAPGSALVTVGDGALFKVRGDLFAGSGVGDGSLFINGETAEKNGGFSVQMETAGNVEVGFENNGLVELKGAALLQTGTPEADNAFRIAGQPGGAGTVHVEGSVQATPLLDIRGDLDVGTEGVGILEVTSGRVSASGGLLFQVGEIEVASRAEDAVRSELVIGQSAFITGPGNGGDTIATISAGKFEVKESLFFANGRVTASGFLSENLVDPNAPLEDSAALIKVLDDMLVGTIDPTVQGDARLRLLNGAVADVGALRISSGDLTVLTAQGLNRASTLQSFFPIVVGNAPGTSPRVGTLRILGESFVEAPEGILVKGTGRVFFTRGAVFPRPRVEAGGKVERLRGAGVKGTGGAPVMEGGLILEDDGLLVINADAGAEPNLVIDGNAELAGDLEVTFPNEKALLAGAVFNLIEIIGAKIGDFGELRFPTRSDDFEGAVTFENGQLVLEVVTPGVAVIAPGATDVNGDSAVDAVDVQLVINAALGNDIGPAFNADANSDGQVNAVDIQLVINAALGLS